jgi:pyrroline-5-carboxylate reductase
VTTIGFIGAGQMATALANGFVNAKLVSASSIYAYDAVPAALTQFAHNIPGVQTGSNNQAVVVASQVIFLAVKPQHMPSAMADAASASNNKLFVSIAAGITLETLCQSLKTQRVVRVMPNTPCLIQQGASAFACGSAVTADDIALVTKLLSAVGTCCELSEKLLDAVTGLSGSGPAFVYVAIEALADGGVRMGLPRNIALQLAAQTVLGAAGMVLTGEHPAVLKDRVASPGGTTIAGLQALEEHGFRAALIAAVQAATLRSQELGK